VREQRLYPLECVAPAAAHGGQRAGDGASFHAGDRRVHERDAAHLEVARDLDRTRVCDRARVHDDLDSRPRAAQRALAQHDVANDVAVGQAQEDDLALRDIRQVRSVARTPASWNGARLAALVAQAVRSAPWRARFIAIGRPMRPRPT
jgi:hypothetical protein